MMLRKECADIYEDVFVIIKCVGEGRIYLNSISLFLLRNNLITFSCNAVVPDILLRWSVFKMTIYENRVEQSVSGKYSNYS